MVFKDMERIKMSGYFIGRKLTDNGKVKLFTYYPEKEGGIPPYYFKTRKTAEIYAKKNNKYKRVGEWIIARANKFIYLDRY